VPEAQPAAARAALAELLAEHGGPGATDALLALTLDPDGRVRRAAFRALAGQPSGAWGERLLKALRADPDSGVRYECLKAIAVARPEGAVELLLELFDSELCPLELIGLVEAVGAYRDPRTRSRLEPLATHADVELRTAAATALAAIENELT
jgi:HEAT repeat protein